MDGGGKGMFSGGEGMLSGGGGNVEWRGRVC